MRTHPSAVLGLVCLSLLVHSALAGLKAADVPGVEKNEFGQWYFEHEGVQWIVTDSEQYDRPFYWNRATEAAVWDDPRFLKVQTERLIAPDPDDPYYRIPQLDMTDIAPPAEGTSTSIVLAVVIPVMLFFAACVGRIAYLQIYYPDLLWPTKERKARYRSSKLKPQKARGKMSQDGKGGRSANS